MAHEPRRRTTANPSVASVRARPIRLLPEARGRLEVGREETCRLEFGARLPPCAGPRERDGQLIVRLRVIGGELYRLPIAGDRAGHVTALHSLVADTHRKGRRLRIRLALAERPCVL